jgi:hypothetical protein
MSLEVASRWNNWTPLSAWKRPTHKCNGSHDILAVIHSLWLALGIVELRENMWPLSDPAEKLCKWKRASFACTSSTHSKHTFLQLRFGAFSNNNNLSSGFVWTFTAGGISYTDLSFAFPVPYEVTCLTLGWYWKWRPVLYHSDGKFAFGFLLTIPCSLIVTAHSHFSPSIEWPAQLALKDYKQFYFRSVIVVMKKNLHC